MADQEQAKPEQDSSAGDGKNTGSSGAADSQTAPQTERSQSERTYTRADLDKALAAAKREERTRYEQQLKDAQLSEAERANKRIAELERDIRQRDAKETILEAARKAGSSNPVAVHAMIQNMIEFDDKTNSISNLTEAIGHARETAPELFPKRPGSANGGEGRSASLSSNMNDIIRRASGRL